MKTLNQAKEKLNQSFNIKGWWILLVVLLIIIIASSKKQIVKEVVEVEKVQDIAQVTCNYEPYKKIMEIDSEGLGIASSMVKNLNDAIAIYLDKNIGNQEKADRINELTKLQKAYNEKLEALIDQKQSVAKQISN